MSDFFIYQLSRDGLEAGDFGHSPGTCGIDALPTGQSLSGLMNAFMFVVDGNNDHAHLARMVARLEPIICVKG